MTEMQRYYRVQPSDRDIMDGPQISRAWHRDETEAQPTDREGVSACCSLEELAEYLATRGDGIPYGLPGWMLVCFVGDLSLEQPLDFEQGEVLVHPTDIVTCELIPDSFFAMIGEAYDRGIS